MSENEVFSDGSDEIPAEILEDAEKLRQGLLPPKSKEKYEAEFNTFMAWMETNKVKKVNESVMLSYFGQLSEKFKPSTLWSKYSMLRATLNLSDKCIKLESYSELAAFLKRKSAGFKSKKAKVFTPEDVKKYLQEAADQDHLEKKVNYQNST